MDEYFLSDNKLEHPMSKFVKNKKNIFYIISLIVFLCFFYFFLLSAPVNFPVGTTVEINSGMSLRNISAILSKMSMLFALELSSNIL